MARAKVTKVSKAAKAMSKEYHCTVWYFCKGSNEGFVRQVKAPRPQDVGFADGTGFRYRGYYNGRIW